MTNWIAAIATAITTVVVVFGLLRYRLKASLTIEDSNGYRDKFVIIVRLDIKNTRSRPLRIHAVRAKEPDNMLIEYFRAMQVPFVDLDDPDPRPFFPPKEPQIVIDQTLTEGDTYDEKIGCLSAEFAKNKASKLVLEMTASRSRGQFKKNLTLKVPDH